MDVHPPKNGINRYWSIPMWYQPIPKHPKKPKKPPELGVALRLDDARSPWPGYRMESQTSLVITTNIYYIYIILYIIYYIYIYYIIYYKLSIIYYILHIKYYILYIIYYILYIIMLYKLYIILYYIKYMYIHVYICYIILPWRSPGQNLIAIN